MCGIRHFRKTGMGRLRHLRRLRRFSPIRYWYRYVFIVEKKTHITDVAQLIDPQKKVRPFASTTFAKFDPPMHCARVTAHV